MPDRIQRKRGKGDRLPPGTLCVTRPGPFGNPFKLVQHGLVAKVAGFEQPSLPLHMWLALGVWMQSGDARQLACDCYEVWAPQQPWFAEALARARKALHLACWCPLTLPDGSPYPCHGNVWRDWANSGLGAEEIRESDVSHV